jgi:hypothetical protein
MLESDALTAVLFCSSHINRQTMVYTSVLKSHTKPTHTTTTTVYKHLYRHPRKLTTPQLLLLTLYNYYMTSFFPLPFHSYSQIYYLATSFLASSDQLPITRDRGPPYRGVSILSNDQVLQQTVQKRTAKNDASVTEKYERYVLCGTFGLLGYGCSEPGQQQYAFVLSKASRLTPITQPASSSGRTAGSFAEVRKVGV